MAWQLTSSTVRNKMILKNLRDLSTASWLCICLTATLIQSQTCLVYCLVFMLFLGCNSADTLDQLANTTASPQADAPNSTKSSDLKKVLDAATTLTNAGDIASATKLLRPLLIEHPNDVTALFLLARCEAAQRNFDAGLALLELIPPTHPEAGLPALGLSADCLIQLGRLDDAEAKLRYSLALQDRFIAAHRRLSQLLNCQGRRVEAMPHLRALARFQAASPSELYGMNAASDPFVQKDETKSVDIPISDLCVAKLQWFSGIQSEAKSMASALLVKAPKSTAASAFAGRVFSVLQDEELFSNWTKNLPPGIDRESEYWYAIGNWHQRQGAHEVAIRCYAEAVQRDDTDRFSYVAMARSLEAVGRGDLAQNANRRSKLLDEVNYIVTGIERTATQLERLSVILNELRRPHEALAWRRLSPERVAAPSPSANSNSINDDNPEWLTCGVITENWPLPELGRIIPHGVSRPELPVAEHGKIQLEDVAGKVELQFQYQLGPDNDITALRMYQITGAGIGVLDFDRDGWPDLYFGQGGGSAFSETESGPNELFRNIGGNHFRNVTSPSSCGDQGYAQGIAAGDIDQDGFIDLIVANIGPSIWLRNNGDGTFTKRLLRATEPHAWTASVACGDLDGDGLPEIVLANYINDTAIESTPCTGRDGANCSPQKFRAAVNEILRQKDDGSWVPWQFAEPGFQANYGLGVLITNIDGRDGNDLYIANDTEPNSLFLSEPAAGEEDRYVLRELAQLRGCAVGIRGNSEGSMGIACGDFDRNGKLDMHITNFANEPSALYLQQDHGIFLNQNIRYGLEDKTFSMVGWGTQAADFDNNGWTDLAILNGHIYPELPDGSPFQMLPQIFRGGTAGFETVENASSSYWRTARLGRALVKLDWNRDGRIDLAGVHLDAPVALLKNDSNSGSWVQVELVATAGERAATGARVQVICANQQWTQWLTSGDGYQSSNEAILSFGLGDEQAIERIEVHWPSGTVSSYPTDGVNRRYLFVENESVGYVR